MANSSESSRQAKRNAFAAESQQRIELNAQIAGIADAIGKTRKLGPQVLALQQGLLAGLQRSQRVESKRLAARHGEKDERVVAAAERAGRYADLQAEAESQASLAGRIVETLQVDDIFSGYVSQSDGTPAQDHTVRIEVSDRTQKTSRQARAKTAADGFFRMILSGDKGGDTKKPTGLDEVVGKVVRALHAQGGEAGDQDAATPVKPDAAAATSKSTGSADSPVLSRVEVLDPNGRVVHEDPVPPTFEGVGSEFRIYLLAEKSPEKPTPKSTGQGKRRG